MMSIVRQYLHSIGQVNVKHKVGKVGYILGNFRSQQQAKYLSLTTFLFEVGGQQLSRAIDIIICPGSEQVNGRNRCLSISPYLTIPIVKMSR